MRSRFSIRSSRLAIAAIASLALLQGGNASAQALNWLGTTSSDFSLPTNWSGNATASSNGSFTERINLNNGAGNALEYSAAQGTSSYSGSVGGSNRGLGSTSTVGGSMIVTGGTLQLQGTSESLLGVNNTGGVAGITFALTIDGGNLTTLSGGNPTFFLGYGNAAGGTQTATVNVNSGNMTVGSLQVGGAGGNHGRGHTGIINLNGGVLQASSISKVTVAPDTNSATVNFNGGTLRAGGTNLIAASVDALNVQNGGAVVNTNGFNNTITQAFVAAGGGGLTKQGTGTLTLNGTNTYTGATLVSAGTLALGSAGSIGTSSGITIASGATFDVSAVTGWGLGSGQSLGGNGTVSGNVTVTGSIAPGNSIGTLAIASNLTWNGGGDAWVFELGPGDTSDLLDITGNFDGSGSGFVFDFNNSSQTGNFTLVEWGGSTTFDESDFTATNLGSGISGDFLIVGNQLQFVAVPEPSTLALVGAGLALVGFRRARGFFQPKSDRRI